MEITKERKSVAIEHGIIAALLVVISLLAHSRGYWRGEANKPQDGWEDEALWWRERHVNRYERGLEAEPNQ